MNLLGQKQMIGPRSHVVASGGQTSDEITDSCDQCRNQFSPAPPPRPVLKPAAERVELACIPTVTSGGRAGKPPARFQDYTTPFASHYQKIYYH